MLLEFRVANHRSLREEQVLSLEDPAQPGPDGPPLRAAALYGANASGKSNVLAALRFVRDAVGASHRFWPPDGGVPRSPFAFGAWRSEPSLFEVTVRLDGERTTFGFVLNDERILEEWLYVGPQGEKQVWYERDRDHFSFGDALKGENRLVQGITRDNSLFLSAAAQNRHEQLWPVFHWFSALFTHRVRTPSSLPRMFADATGSLATPQRRDRVRALLREADFGITDFEQRADGVLYLQHRSAAPDAWLRLSEESEGTRQLFLLAPNLLDALDRGGVLLIDELEASLHPLLARRIVQVFNDPSENGNGAQLIFTTHDTNLLGSLVGAPLLRREQIWLTEKNDEGATVLYPLTDFKAQEPENVERGYLQGRDGAIPFLGALAFKRGT